MKLALFLSLLQMVIVLGIESSPNNVQVTESGVVDVCSQTKLTQLTMLGLLEEVREEVKQTHTDTTLKHDNILTQVTQGDTNILYRVSQVNTDIISQLTQGHNDVIQSEVAILEAVKQLSADVTNRLEQKENALETCNSELTQTRTQLNQTQVSLTQTQTSQIMIQTDLENTKATLEQQVNDSAALQAALQQELSEARFSLEQQVNLTAAMEQQQATLEQELSETRTALQELQVEYNQSVEAEGCSAPFRVMSTVGCVYLSPEDVGDRKSWEDARQACRAMGGDLYTGRGRNKVTVAGDFIRSVHGDIGNSVWVGIKGRRWLDGRDVTSDEWSSGQPDGRPQECGGIIPYSGYNRIHDIPCSYYRSYLCQSV